METSATFQIVHAKSQKVLDIYAGGKHSEANVTIYEAHHGQNQRWGIFNNEDGTVQIINPISGKALDVNRGDTANTPAGTNVQIYDVNGSNAQKWRIKPIERGLCKLLHACSGMALNVKDGGVSNATNVEVWRENDSDAQKWEIRRIN
ncbi:unnamed protein product [Rotaria sp. Silwood1]|nr:unnamed protein product [Rotaria sp. Silwood1]CAF1652067.1 unnamed protein product [Rotaria sp. Silwood1]